MDRYLFVAGGCAVLLLLSFASTSWSQFEYEYELVYPEPDANAATTPLYFGLMQSFGGDFTGVGTVPGVQVALDQVNSDPSLLPGYSLHFTLTDSQCNRTVGLRNFFPQIFNPPTKIGWIGSGCSSATEPTAEISHFYNLNQISCLSSSSELANRVRFRRYFQVLATDDGLAIAYFGLIQQFGWRRVALIVQNENLFTVTIDRLKMLLDDADIAYNERDFETEDGPMSLDEPFDPDSRIFILAMYEEQARILLCEAHRLGIRYPRHLLITLAWYSTDWWLQPESDTTVLGCTNEDRERVVPYTLAVQHFEYISNESIVATPGINGSQYLELYHRHLRDSSVATLEDDTDYSQDCYDATWAFVYALNKTIQDLEDDDTNALASEASGLPSGERFKMENFTYENNVVADLMFEHLRHTDFLGLTGQINFNTLGIREGITRMVHQYRFNMRGGLELIDVGHVLEAEDNYRIVYEEGENESTFWPPPDRLVPYDGVPIESDVTVAIAITVILSILATAGIVFAVVCLVFNFIFRERKLIRLTSPKLNYIIGGGAIVLYVNVYIYVIPTTDPDTTAALCTLAPWLTSLGYSLCFGTILVKMARVYYIFNNPDVKKRALKDWHLAVGVLIMVVIDLIILVVYTAVEGARGNLEAERVPNTENREEVEGELEIINQYFIYICTSTSRSITLGILYGYKAILQAIALLFAFSTRKVNVKGLNDSKYIGGAIYVTSIETAVIIVSTYTLEDSVNGYAFVFGFGLLVVTTIVLVLVFVPKMIALYRDPLGEKIFSKSDPVSSLSQPKTPPPIATDVSVEALRRRISELELSQQTQNTSSVSSLPQRDSRVRFSVVVNSQKGSSHHSSSSIDSSSHLPDVNED